MFSEVQRAVPDEPDAAAEWHLPRAAVDQHHHHDREHGLANLQGRFEDEGGVWVFCPSVSSRLPSGVPVFVGEGFPFELMQPKNRMPVFSHDHWGSSEVLKALYLFCLRLLNESNRKAEAI